MDIDKNLHILYFEGVPVTIHRFSAFLCALILVLSIKIGPSLLVVYISILFVMLIHEIGHALVAKRFGYNVFAIRLYIIHGECVFAEPHTLYEKVLIIWGGPLAQLLLFISSSLILMFFGYSSYNFYNIILVIFCYYNFANLLFNLIPLSWLDGGTAWKIIPMLLEKNKTNRKY